MAAIVKGSVDGYSVVLGSDVEFIVNASAPLLLKYRVERSISSYLEIGKNRLSVFVVTVIAIKLLFNRFQPNFTHSFFGAKFPKSSLYGIIILIFSKWHPFSIF